MKMKRPMRLDCILNWGLIHFPKLMEELPQMLLSLDAGETINVPRISDKPLRLYLDYLFSSIPGLKVTTGGEWFRSSSDESVAVKVVHELTKMEVVKPSRSNSRSEAQAVRFCVPRLLHLLVGYPSLREELPPLLKRLRGGDSARLDGLQEELRRELLQFLDVCGVVADRSENYCLPSSREQREYVRAVLDHLLHALKCAQRAKKSEKLKAIADLLLTVAPSASNAVSPSSGESSDASSRSSASSDEDSDGSSEPADIPSNSPTAKRKISTTTMIGPAMPSQQQFDIAKSLQKSVTAHGVETEEDDVGPTPFQGDQRTAEGNGSAPLGGLAMVEQPPSESSSHDVTSFDMNVREEWMLTPGENKTAAELYSHPTNIVNRKFQTGKLAKKKAEEVSSASQEILARQQRERELGRSLPESDEAGNGVEDPESSERGPSLMELHLEKKGRGPAVDGKGRRRGEGSGIGERFFDFEGDRESASMGGKRKMGGGGDDFEFDYDEVMRSGPKKISKHQVTELVEQAKQLGDRFSRGTR